VANATTAVIVTDAVDRDPLPATHVGITKSTHTPLAATIVSVSAKTLTPGEKAAVTSVPGSGIDQHDETPDAMTMTAIPAETESLSRSVEAAELAETEMDLEVDVIVKRALLRLSLRNARRPQT
jgi:hypothetical protein